MNAYAQTTLPPVSQAGGIDWPLLLAILMVLGIIALIVWYKHKNPAGAAAAGAVVSADATAAWHTIAAELTRIRTAVEAKMTPTPVEPPAPEPAPAAIPGKSGQAGTFTAPVTGDPAVDLPALMAQYSAK